MIVRVAAAASVVVLAACGAGDDAAPGVSTTPVTQVATTPAPTSGAPRTPDPPAVSTAAPEQETTSTPTTATPVTEPSVVPSPDCVRVTDFDEATWLIVNDGVMGGQSVGEAAIADGILSFEGTIVTQGGGFSSVRGPIDGELVGAAELVMRVRTDGREYELLADDEPTRGQRVTHYAPIAADGGEWQEVAVPLTEMDARVFGQQVGSPGFQPDLATEIGVILADGIDGPFLFEIDWIDACA